MNRRAIRQTAIAALAAVTMIAAASPARADCVPWNSAGAIISKNSLVPGNVIYDKVQSKTGGKVISATLCESGGKFVYKIVVLGKKGDVKNITVDARSGSF